MSWLRPQPTKFSSHRAHFGELRETKFSRETADPSLRPAPVPQSRGGTEKARDSVRDDTRFSVLASCGRRATHDSWDLVEVPEVDGVTELDADLFAAFGIAETVDDLGFGAGTLVFAAEDDGAAFFDGAAAQ
jgi:hypothetical protein